MTDDTHRENGMLEAGASLDVFLPLHSDLGRLS